MVQIFVATMGFRASHMWRPRETRRFQVELVRISEHWIFLGAPTEYCDLKAAVCQSHRYEPTLNRTYAELGSITMRG